MSDSNDDDHHRKKVKHYDNGEPHFLTFSCFRRLPLLSRDRTRNWFIETLQAARKRHGFHLWAWVIMPEHIHVLLWPPFDLISLDPRSMRGRVSGILSSVKRPVGEKGIEYLRENSPEYLRKLAVSNGGQIEYRFWQSGSGHDENVSDPISLHALVDYVHRNPVRRGLVDRPEDWRWSSARDWHRLADSPLEVDRTLPETLDIPWSQRRG